MPGRRLILVLVMLLVTLSVLSASRDISRRGPAGQTTPSTTPGQTQAPSREKPADRNKAKGEERPKKVDAVERRLPSSKPVRVRLGDRVVLQVRTGQPDIVSIDQLGVRAPTGPGTTGTIDFIAGTAGEFTVTLAVSEKKIGSVVVAD